MTLENWGAWRGGAVTAQLGGKRQLAWSLYQNDLFIVTCVPFHCDIGSCVHVVLRRKPSWLHSADLASDAPQDLKDAHRLANSSPSWSEKQRIKDELIGPERLAVEVFPPRSELVDQADAYHLWVLPEGFTLPFGVEETTDV